MDLYPYIPKGRKEVVIRDIRIALGKELMSGERYA